MKINTSIFSIIFSLIITAVSFSQPFKTDALKKWEINTEANFYFTDPFFISPVITADINRLHLELRYSYEELETFSGWTGFNFIGGKDFYYEITPMAGFITGRLKGIAPGLRLTLGYSGIEFSSESEYVFDTEDNESNYFYNFSDLSYSPAEWIYFGFSFQRTKVINTDSDFQPGIMAGVSYKNLDITGYFFMPEEEDKYFILNMSCEF
ncbi:MAG: hypothetical protein HGGPFJEG_00685 [Ignavibacteria bacterium]|nr:hypothetical protein [Ignavibacteria bacterium]